MLIDNVQNERVAIIKDDVRRGLGMLPQRAIFEKTSEGDFVKMSKPVQVCTACHFCPEFGTKSVIPKVGLSRILQRKPVTKAFFNEIFGITFCWFALSGQSNFRIWKNNSG